jgi:hypothetical protein
MHHKPLAAAATLAACAGLAVFAAAGIGGSPAPEPLAPGGYDDLGAVELTRAGAAPPAAAGLAARRMPRKPRLTQLIATRPVPVAPGTSGYVGLRCTKKQGVPVTGGGVLPPDGALTFGVLSRFDPNDPSTGEPRTFYVGAHNDSGGGASFLPTLTCVKRVAGG